MNEEQTHVVYCRQCGTALLQTPDPGGKRESWPCYMWRDPVTRKPLPVCPGCGASTVADAFTAEPVQIQIWRSPHRKLVTRILRAALDETDRRPAPDVALPASV